MEIEGFLLTVFRVNERGIVIAKERLVGWLVTFLGTLYSTMKEPGFSRARERPFKLGPATTVASVMVARSLRSPALKAREPIPVVLSASYLPLREAFIVTEKEREERAWSLVRAAK